MPFLDRLTIKEYGARTWKLVHRIRYQGKYETFEIPAGYITDFATVPRFMHWAVSPYGAYTNAAILHDYLITHLIVAKLITSRDADGVFRRVMQECKVPWFTRWLMWATVRVASLFNPRRAYGRNFMADAPRAVGMILLAMPVILPGALVVLVCLGVVKLLEQI